jgi:hypothetical protein
MFFATAISLLLSIIAIVISVRAFRYTKRQTEIMESQESRKQREDQSMVEWAAKFDEAASAVVTIVPRSIFGTGTPGYPSIFPDGELRTRIEAYLIDADFGRNRFTARQANPEQLRMPIVRQTIQRVLDRVKEFRESDPENARRLGL